MPATMAPELSAQVISCDIDPVATARLAGLYHRGIARSLWEAQAGTQGSVELPGGPQGWREVGWLHPRAVLASAVVRSGRDLGSQRWAAVLDDMEAARGDRPTLLHAPDPSPAAWADDGLERMGREVLELRPGSERLRQTSRDITAVRSRFADALDVLRTVWPEAAAEIDVLLRVIVHCDGTASTSCTEETTFGAVYVALDPVTGVVAAVDTLLHESGHHALVLRNAFAPFLENPEALTHHALRPDPRPLSGVLHAAHVLGRMATGLARWRASAPDDVRDEVERLARHRLSGFGRTLETLEVDAHWTAEGEAFLRSLRATYEELEALAAA